MNYYWLFHSIAYWSLTLFIVPKKYLKKLLLFAFIGGFIYTIIVQYTAVNFLHFWRYKPTFLYFYNIPFFFIISWFGVTMLYGYLLIQYPDYQLYIIGFFAFWTTIDNYFTQRAGVIMLTNWSLSLTFLFAVFSHIFILYLLKIINNVDEIGPKLK